MRNQHSITSLPESPDQDRRRRTIQYSIAMSVRMVFVVMCFFAQGWWLLVAALGAVLLPYVAVVLANNVGPRGGQSIAQPGDLALEPPVTSDRVFRADHTIPTSQNPADSREGGA